MLTGALVVESLRTGAVLEGVNLVVRRISRAEVTDVTAHQPRLWTLEFAADSETAEELARRLADALDGPGWYASFEMEEAGRVFVVFPGKILRYIRGDESARADAVAHALAAGVPESQCDW
jgi:hypothetical protein